MSFKLGAYVLKNGKVVSSGYNINTRTMFRKETVPTGIHAERNALDLFLKSNRLFRIAPEIIIRIKKTSNIGLISSL